MGKGLRTTNLNFLLAIITISFLVILETTSAYETTRIYSRTGSSSGVHYNTTTFVNVKIRVNGKPYQPPAKKSPDSIPRAPSQQTPVPIAPQWPHQQDAVPTNCGPTMRRTETGQCECWLPEERPSVFYTPHNQCYYLYTQGPCETDKWLVVIGRQPWCVLNPCLAPGKKFNYVYVNNQCMLLGTSCGFKRTGSLWYEEIISFRSRYHTIPECVSRPHPS